MSERIPPVNADREAVIARLRTELATSAERTAKLVREGYERGFAEGREYTRRHWTPLSQAAHDLVEKHRQASSPPGGDTTGSEET